MTLRGLYYSISIVIKIANIYWNLILFAIIAIITIFFFGGGGQLLHIARGVGPSPLLIAISNRFLATIAIAE